MEGGWRPLCEGRHNKGQHGLEQGCMTQGATMNAMSRREVKIDLDRPRL